MSRKTAPAQSANKALLVLRVLERNFAQGFSPSELAEATGLDRPAVTRALASLEEHGYAETLAETGRVRLSHRLAQVAVQVLASLDRVEAKVNESRQRIAKPAGLQAVETARHNLRSGS